MTKTTKPKICFMTARAWLVAAGLLFSPACGREERRDPRPFLGDWVFATGNAVATCLGMKASQELRGIEASITERANGDLVFSIGLCQMQMKLSGTHAVAYPGQMCDVSLNGTTVMSRPSSWVVETLIDGSLQATSTGTASVSPTPEVTAPCETFAVTGTLVRKTKGAEATEP